MGLFSNLFNRKKSTPSATKSATADELLTDEQQRAKDDQAEADALKRKAKADSEALAKRKKNMQGGGRAGLMFGGNESGVA